MLWEALGSVLLGLALAWTAAYKLSGRLPSRRVVFATGPAGALFGSVITHSALGSGHPLATLLGAVVVSAVTLSLLLRRIRQPAAVRPTGPVTPPAPARPSAWCAPQ